MRARYTLKKINSTVFETAKMVQHFEDERIDRRGILVEGRKLLFGALGAYLIFILLSKLISLPWILSGPLAIGILAASMLGANKICLSLNDPPLARMIFAISMIIPFVGLAVIIVLLVRAQRAMQTAA